MSVTPQPSNPRSFHSDFIAGVFLLCVFLQSQVAFAILPVSTDLLRKTKLDSLLPVCQVCKQLAEVSRTCQSEKYVDVSEHALLNHPHT